MQIEFIGCTSSGKSTLIQNIVQTTDGQTGQPITSYDFVLAHFGLGWVTHHKVRMALLNIFTLLACLATLRRHRELLRLTLNVLRDLPSAVPWIDKVKVTRLVCRNIGIYEIVGRYSTDEQIVLADEGMLQIAHYLFVHLAAAPDMKMVSAFVSMTPLPDAVIYLRQPDEVLINRTRARGHHRVPDNSLAGVACFIQRAAAVFEHIAQASVVQDRIIVVQREGGRVVAQPTRTRLLPATLLDTLLAAYKSANVEQLDPAPHWEKNLV